MIHSSIKLYYPYWIFPNLGDAINVTFIPKILKRINPDIKIEIVTSGFLIDIFKLDSNVDIVREPTQQELYFNYREFAFSENTPGSQKFCLPNIKVIWADWHPRVFDFWKQHSAFMQCHPTANLITLNFLLQLDLEYLLFDPSLDFREFINVPVTPNTSDFINVGIVPATKLSGKSSPHPNCNGVGFRFNGAKGMDSWKEFVQELRRLNKKIKIYEFSKENFGLGDVHLPDSDIFTLIKNVDLMDVGVMSDGGVHHAFNARNKPVVLFQATKINKVEFFKLSNTSFPEHLHLECRKKCPSYFTEVFGGNDKSQTCKLECETMNPKLLAAYIAEKVI